MLGAWYPEAILNIPKAKETPNWSQQLHRAFEIVPVFCSWPDGHTECDNTGYHVHSSSGWPVVTHYH